MSLVGLDCNTTRIRAVSSPRDGAVTPHRLGGTTFDLPLALSLRERTLTVGAAGSGLSRSLPHLACLDFLPFLGLNKTWHANEHHVDADRALGIVFEAMRRDLRYLTGAGLALPAYLTDIQITRLRRLAELSRWKPMASLPVPLAAVLGGASGVEGPLAVPPDPSVVIVGDVDGHAFTWSGVEVRDGKARLLFTHSWPMLGRGIWLRRLLDGVALRCIRLSRRDPRESGAIEQHIYDQLDELLEVPLTDAPIEVSVEGGTWYHHLQFQPVEFAYFASPLLRQTLIEFDNVLTERGHGVPPLVLLTPSAGYLPGLIAGLERRLGRWSEPAGIREDSSDFGESLVCEENAPHRVFVLGPEAIARAAHMFAGRLTRRELRTEHYTTILLPREAAILECDDGPARVSFRGQDHVLSSPTFSLGRDSDCDIVFEGELYPTVSGRHCDIIFDRRAYTLYDHSRHGTLLNDQPVRQPSALHSGDWIRLGPAGPVLRFLGQLDGRSAYS
jgi:FHA domain